MIVIYKYPLPEIMGRCTIEIPGKEPELLRIGIQDNRAYIWVLINTDDAIQKHEFLGIGTGRPWPAADMMRCYLGTVDHPCPGGTLVVHWFAIDIAQTPELVSA